MAFLRRIKRLPRLQTNDEWNAQRECHIQDWLNKFGRINLQNIGLQADPGKVDWRSFETEQAHKYTLI